MSSVSTKWILELVDKITAPLKSIDGNVQQITKDTGGMNTALKETSAININAIADSFRALSQRLNEAVAPGIKFQEGLAEVEAITGVTGKALDSLGTKARSSAKQFGGEASDSLNNYKVLLSKLGPDIAQNEGALDGMNKNVLTLSKTMKGDANAAVEALTTSMLQFRVDLTDPIKAGEEMTRMMNTMAAGAKFGSAEVPEVSQAIKVSGVAASQAKVSFEEANAAIQELARGGKNGAEGGMALRNVLGKIAGEDVIPKEALQKLKAYGVDMSIVSNTAIPFTDRLRELGKAQNDATVFAQIFGVENAAAAAILVRSVDEQDALREKITGTNTATEQASVIMGTFAEKMKRIKATVSDYGISIFNATESYLPFISGGFEAIDVLADLKNAQQGLAMVMDTKLGKGLKALGSGFLWAAQKAWTFIAPLVSITFNLLGQAVGYVLAGAFLLGSFVVGLVTATAAQFGLNIAMNANPIGLIVLGIALAVAAIIVMIKYWSEIKSVIVQFTTWVWNHSPFKFIIDLVEQIFPGFKAKVTEVFEYVKGLVLGFWEKIKEVWGDIKSFFGFGSDVKAKVEVKYDANGQPVLPDLVEGKKPSTSIIPPISGGAVATGTGTGTSGSGSGKTITMHLDVKNYFQMSPGNWRDKIDDIADQVVGKINDRMRDATIALD